MTVDPLLRAREGAALLGISISTFWRHVQDGIVPPPVKVGGSTRWLTSDIQSVISQAASQNKTPRNPPEFTSDGEALLCPICSSDYLHQEMVEIYDRKEDAEHGMSVRCGVGARLDVSTSMAGNPSARRHAVVINFQCEMCGAKPSLVLAQHKGQTLVRWS